ncbi:MAG: radical SAM protein [Hyphomicrobiaceae bacterium]
MDIRSASLAPAPLVDTPQPSKFRDPDRTAKGDARASVPLARLDTLWINTGTLCNITCQNCYIESSPLNDRLAYISATECAAYLDEIAALGLPTGVIGFTGGEPFLNPQMLAMATDALARGHKVLILTNGMQPMQRPKIKQGLLALKAQHGIRLTLRISLDHHTKLLHETERGRNTWDKALAGIDWLASNDFDLAIAGRTCWGEPEASERAGYAALIMARGWPVDPNDNDRLMLLPEMDGLDDVPEISTACWGVLHKSPAEIMCATSRMIVKRKGAATPVVVPCTLLPYEPEFEMANTLQASLTAHGGMFDHGAVKLCHVNCAKFCVLGGGSCS